MLRYKLVPIHAFVQQGFYYPLASFWFRRGLYDMRATCFHSKN